MNKNLKLYFILAFAFSGVMIAWNTLSSFFKGVGLNFVALVIIVGVMFYVMFTDASTRVRTRDLFILSCVFAVMEFLVYVVFEYGTTNINVYEGFSEFQTFLSIMGLIYLAYIGFRFFTELKNIRFGFMERILGNSSKKEKANKELVNGSLEEKPNQKAHGEEAMAKDSSTEEIIVTEEE